MLKKRKIKEITMRLQDFIKEQSIKDEQTDHKFSCLHQEINHMEQKIIKEKKKHLDTIQILDLERAKVQ